MVHDRQCGCCVGPTSYPKWAARGRKTIFNQSVSPISVALQFLPFIRPGSRPICTDTIASVSEIIALFVIGQNARCEIMRLRTIQWTICTSGCLRCANRLTGYAAVHVHIGGYQILDIIYIRLSLDMSISYTMNFLLLRTSYDHWWDCRSMIALPLNLGQ